MWFQSVSAHLELFQLHSAYFGPSRCILAHVGMHVLVFFGSSRFISVIVYFTVFDWSRSWVTVGRSRSCSVFLFSSALMKSGFSWPISPCLVNVGHPRRIPSHSVHIRGAVLSCIFRSFRICSVYLGQCRALSHILCWQFSASIWSLLCP